MRNDEKQRRRTEKRAQKRRGSKLRRRVLKRQLEVDPEGAHHAEFEFGRATTIHLNGLDRDPTRRRDDEEE